MDWSIIVKEGPSVGSPFWGDFSSDRIPKATNDVNIHFYPHLGVCMTLRLVVGLVWSNEAWSYAGGSVAAGRASHAILVRDEDPD